MQRLCVNTFVPFKMSPNSELQECRLFLTSWAYTLTQLIWLLLSFKKMFLGLLMRQNLKSQGEN